MANWALYVFFSIGFLDTACTLKPHIIFILADDLGWNDVGFHGSNQIPTPNIDALAYTGIVLNNYYVTPICTPSRSALLTGKYPIHTGLQHGVIHGWAPYGLNLNETLLPQFLKNAGYVSQLVGKWHLGMQYSVLIANEPWGLGLDQKILPQFLKEEGYATAAVGKWHLGHFRHQYLPESRGFDSHYGYWTGHQDYYDHTAVDRPGYWGYDMRRGMEITWSDYGHYTTDLFTKEAVKIIQNHDAKQPLFLYMAHLATHSGNGYNPLQAPKETQTKFQYIQDKKRRLFAGMLSKLDDSVGAVVSALAAKNMLNNSLIVFSTDNGGAAAGFDDNVASNWPLRGVKDTLWEGGVRGVGLVWSPLLPSSQVSNTMIHITDWLPTFLTIINATKIPNDLDGVSVWNNFVESSTSSRNEILLNIDPERKVSGIRYDNWKYLKGRTNNWNNWYGPSGRNHSYNWDELYNSPSAKAIKKIKEFPERSQVEKIRDATKVICFKHEEQYIQEEVYLFDIGKDPCEQQNLVNNHPEIVELMEKKLQKYLKTMVKPRNKPLDTRSHPKFWGYAWVNWMDFV